MPLRCIVSCFKKQRHMHGLVSSLLLKGTVSRDFLLRFFFLNQLIMVLLEMSTPKAVLIFSLPFSLSYLTLKTNPRYLLLLNPCLCQNDCYLKKIHIFFIPQIQRKAWSTLNPGYRSKLL